MLIDILFHDAVKNASSLVRNRAVCYLADACCQQILINLFGAQARRDRVALKAIRAQYF